MSILELFTVTEKLLKAGNSVWKGVQWRRHDPLKGDVSTGIGVARRIIALFGAHGVKQTQIYRLLGDRFPHLSPDLDAEKLQSYLNGELITEIAKLFGVRREWLEGEDGQIYEPLIHYKNLPEFERFARTLTEGIPSHCYLYAFKPHKTAQNLYKYKPDIALVFASPIAELERDIIYRYYPVFGPFPWDHEPARFNLLAFFTIADQIPHLVLKGFEVSTKAISELSLAISITHHHHKIRGIWQPFDYVWTASGFRNKQANVEKTELLEYVSNLGLDRYFGAGQANHAYLHQRRTTRAGEGG